MQNLLKARRTSSGFGLALQHGHTSRVVISKKNHNGDSIDCCVVKDLSCILTKYIVLHQKNSKSEHLKDLSKTSSDGAHVHISLC